MDKEMNQKKNGSGGSIFRRLLCRITTKQAFRVEDDVPCNTPRRSGESRADVSFRGVSSSGSGSSGGDASMGSAYHVRDHGTLLSMQPWIFRKGNYSKDEKIRKVNGECSNSGYDMDDIMYNSLAEASPNSVGLGNMQGRGRSFLRTRHARRRSIKPLASTENCQSPQFHNKKFEAEEFVYSSFSSSKEPESRPFLVTDRSNIISRSSVGDMAIPSETAIHKGNMENATGGSPLPKLRTPRQRGKESPHRKLDSFNSQRSCRFSLRKDSLDRMCIFSIGVSLGITYTILSNRKEINKLNGMLKSKENLVQDLQEELEMKESLTVKELANEAYGCLKPSDCVAVAESMKASKNQVSASYSPPEQEGEHDQLQFPKEDSRSKIEAELEIELARLELNINASGLNGRMPSFSELDPDPIGDIVHWELKADMRAGGVAENHDDNAYDSKSTSTNHTHDVNYAVSPQELRMRLHEVIQHRLEKRIKELERELQHARKQLQLVESEHLLPQRAFSGSEMGSSSNQDSPTAIVEHTALSQPFCLNFAGDALDAYNEAYEEFMLVTKTENNEAYEEFMLVTKTENTLPSAANSNEELRYGLHSSDRDLIWGMEGPKHCRREPTWEQNFINGGSNDDAHDIHATNEDYHTDDEMNRLIEQVLERTRQGSPMVLHAQRMLFSMDE